MEPDQLWATSRQTSLRLLAYVGAGASGPSVVVLHGLRTGVDVLRGVRPGLDPYAVIAGEGFNVLALDWPGHGRSGGARGHLTYRHAMDAAASAVSLAQRRWGGRVGLLGTSLGGVLAFYAALEDDAVDAVVCHDVVDLRELRPVLRRWRHQTLLPVAGLLRRRLTFDMQRRVRLPAAAILARADLAEDPPLAAAIVRHPQSPSSYDLAGIGSILLSPEEKPDVSAQRTPTFVAVGSADLVIPETAAKALVSRLTCPHELWVLPGAGHQLLLEHHRAFVPAAAEFLRAHLG